MKKFNLLQNATLILCSLARGLEVLNAFTPQRQRLTISQLSQKTHISRAAVRRCLYTLATLGMVHSPDGRSYELLPRVLTVGHAYLAGTPLAKAAQISLDNLSKSLSQSCWSPHLMGMTCCISHARQSITWLASILAEEVACLHGPHQWAAYC